MTRPPDHQGDCFIRTPLARSFYDRDPISVARSLLGMQLVRASREGIVSGQIVEVEAYLAENDPACHAARGPTRSNQSIFGPAGHAYVYPIHSRHCVNAVTEPANRGSAVLIRAVEPLKGIELMRNRRRADNQRDLTRGPARLCEAFDIDRSLDGWDLTTGSRLWITAGDPPAGGETGTSRRVGVTSAKDLELRFFVAGNPCVSRLPGPGTA